jgi:cardiolipin synthase
VLTYHPINPITLLQANDRDHRKIMIVDGRIGFTGGINLSHTYENPASAGIPPDGDTRHAYWRDTAVEIRGPAVAELQKLFFGTWQQQNGDPMQSAVYFPPLARQGVQTVRVVGSAPGDDQPLYYLSIEEAIRKARSRIWLSSGYFVPPHQEREDLGNAARRAVDLRIIVPSHSDVEAAVYAGRAAYGDLLARGAHIYEMQTAVLHSKLATVDGVWCPDYCGRSPLQSMIVSGSSLSQQHVTRSSNESFRRTSQPPRIQDVWFGFGKGAHECERCF